MVRDLIHTKVGNYLLLSSSLPPHAVGSRQCPSSRSPTDGKSPKDLPSWPIRSHTPQSHGCSGNLRRPREPGPSSLHALDIESGESVQPESFGMYMYPGGAIAAPYEDHKRDLPCHTSDRSTKTDRYRSTLPSFVGLDHRRCLPKSPRAPGDLGFSQQRRCFAWDSLNSGEP